MVAGIDHVLALLREKIRAMPRKVLFFSRRGAILWRAMQATELPSVLTDQAPTRIVFMDNTPRITGTDADWRPLNLEPGARMPARLGEKTTPRERTHLPAAHENRTDAIHAYGPVMRVTQQPIPRLENPAHQHLISQESSDGARGKMYLLNHLASAFGAPDYEHLYWADLTSQSINTIMAQLRDFGYKESSRNAYLTAMKSSAKEAWLLGQMELETYEKIRAIRRVKSDRIQTGKSQSMEMLVDLVEAVRNEGKLTSRRNALLLEIMIFTGMRRREVRSIRVPDHIFYDKQDILIQGKGGKDRWSKLPETIWDNLIDYLHEERTWEPGALFCAYWNKRSRPIISDKGLNVSNVNRILESAVKLYVTQRDDDYNPTEAQITPHDLRRSFATALYEMDHSPRAIQIILGHSSLSTTEGYLHDEKDGYRDEASKSLDDILKAKRG